MHASPPPLLLEQLLIIANADDYLIFAGIDRQPWSAYRPRSSRRRRRRRWPVLTDWLVLVASCEENRQLVITAVRGRSVGRLRADVIGSRTKRDGLRARGAECLELWQCSEQVQIAAACLVTRQCSPEALRMLTVRPHASPCHGTALLRTGSDS